MHGHSRMTISRRTYQNWLHWLLVPLFVCFLLVTPDDVLPFGPRAFQFHSILALIFVSLSLLWTADLMWHGLASRPGPKLKGWQCSIHRGLRLTLIWGLCLIAVGGFLLGLTSSRQLKAGGFLPMAPPMGWPDWNEVVGTFHIYQFYLLGLVAALHAAFHIWRHYRLRDGALRIMLSRTLHRCL